MKLNFSIIIPVFNRPNEIDELLESLTQQDFQEDFEVIIVEDGSSQKSDEILSNYSKLLNIRYFFKENSGAGNSRNFGMQHASGNYFILLDSDVILPKNYITEVKKGLEKHFTDAFGGPDAAHKSFNLLQKSINYSMTAILTTGGIRGKKNSVGKFQPRSFNMGISRKAFEKTLGFSEMKIAEDIDLTQKLWQLGFKTQLLTTAFVYHKRRSSLQQFFNQTYQFGKARPLLSKKYPSSSKITYWFPTIFIIFFDCGLFLWLFGIPQVIILFGCYFLLIFFDSLIQNKNPIVAFVSIVSTFTQFLGYGLGFLETTFFGKTGFNKKK